MSDDRPNLRLTILVVEDDSDTQAYMREVMRSDYDVVTASSVSAARSLLSDAEREISLILVDLSLKGTEDGLDLTREVRRRNQRIPIIAVTAHAQSADRRRSLEAGCDRYFAKPVDPKTLMAAVREMITERRGRESRWK